MKNPQFAMVLAFAGCAIFSSLIAGAEPNAVDPGFFALFPKDGTPEGWVVREWNDVSKPAVDAGKWEVKDGILYGSEARGCWLMCEKEYGDFILEYDFKLGPRGNSGCALRSPMKGDPAFDGLEMQMADFRYNTEAKDSELTGGFYRALAPTKQVYKPEDWNHYRIELRGDRAKVTLNGTVIHDIRFADYTETVKRHDGTDASPLAERPKRGHIGFQELSRENSRVMIRGARIKVLDAERGDEAE
jgi:hypothetical protein